MWVRAGWGRGQGGGGIGESGRLDRQEQVGQIRMGLRFACGRGRRERQRREGQGRISRQESVGQGRRGLCCACGEEEAEVGNPYFQSAG